MQECEKGPIASKVLFQENVSIYEEGIGNGIDARKMQFKILSQIDI